MWTLLIYGILRRIETNDDHCGYEFPWSIYRVMPFGTDATYHNFHHTKNLGNYSSFMTVWDTVFNSNAEYYESLKVEG